MSAARGGIRRRVRAARYGIVRGVPMLRTLRLLHFRRRRRVERIADRLMDAHDDRVLSGPFAGMVYPRPAGDLGFLPRLVGSYEAELHEHIEQVVEDGPSLVVVVGAGDGYYAVGLALRLPEARVIAFEAHSEMRRVCTELAQANGVAERVRVAGRCTPDTLVRALREEEETFVFMDCEGCEVELLDPRRVPGIESCDLVVELHDFLVPDNGPLIRDRFSPTHSVRIVRGSPTSKGRCPGLSLLDEEDQRFALDEFRPGSGSWAVIRRRRPS